MEGTMSEIRFFAGNFQPKSWANCDGRLLAISANSALFSLLGVTYGGDGRVTFGLPDFRSRVPVGTGTGPGIQQYALGEMTGTPTQTLLQSNLPAHNHPGQCNVTVPTFSEAGTSGDPSSAILASKTGLYKTGTAADSYLASTGGVVVVATAGGNLPMEMEQPYLAMNFIICLYGIYPSRN